ncbi:MAG: desulfoferrodoxin family protein [Planctomycetota bacterium]
MNENELSRRELLRAGVAAVTVAVPALAWSCSNKNADSSGGGGAKVSAADLERIAELEKDGVFTAADPGPWAGKDKSHVPQVTFPAGQDSVELYTAHPMSPEHYITAQYVKDQDGNLIAFASHKGTDDEARVTLPLPPGTTSITAYSHCNKHGDWSAPRAHVG